MTAAVAIIGAGMAGLSPARMLRDAGISVILFDKGRGLGGRMSTRKRDEIQFDHGVQYFTARGTGFQILISELKDRGAVAEWSNGMLPLLVNKGNKINDIVFNLWIAIWGRHGVIRL